MQIIENWEKRSTIRNRPRRLLVADASKYYFPIIQQPLCLHPLVIALGEKVKQYILIQSAYMFMKTISVNETGVVCAIANKIIQGKTKIPFPKEICQNLLTVIIDEAYHAYVANDFIQQLSTATNIKPIEMNIESSLSRAITVISKSLPQQYRIFFKIIAVCIAENSITKELITVTKDPKVNKFFNEINADHTVDEGRHCRIFLEVLTHLWQEISEVDKESIGPLIPSFIYEYFRRDVKIKNDRKILSQLKLAPDEIEKILYDTHPEYTLENLRLINPIVDNIITLLQKSGVLFHESTADAFKTLDSRKPLSFQTLNSWQIDFLLSTRDPSPFDEMACQTILLNLEISSHSCCGLFISYLHDVTQSEQISFMLKASSSANETVCVPMVSKVTSANTIQEFTRQFEADIAYSMALGNFLTEREVFASKLPLWVDLTQNFFYAKNHPEVLQIHIFKNANNQLKISIYYHLKYHDQNRIFDLLENFSYYLKIALKNESSLRKEIPLVSPRQRQQLLKQSSNHEANPQHDTLITLFTKQVHRNPQKLAIIDNMRTVTYQELDEMSDIVAINLRNMGLTSGRIIAVIHDHSYAYMALIIGIMKAGMIFLPLSNDDPLERLRAIFKEAKVGLIIIDREQLDNKLCAEFSFMTSAQMLKPGENRFDLAQVEPTHDDLAYIIYTSGSTGMPKGVTITHLSLANLAQSVVKTFPITKNDRVLQFAIYSFDASLAEISGTLISGATLCIRTGSMLDSSSQFFSECLRLKITLLNLPTPLWCQLVEDLATFSLPLPATVKTVIIGGEAIVPAILDKWYQQVGTQIRLVNTYGPTETAIAVTACDLGAYPLLRSRASLIGTAIANAFLYVLDQFHRLLPIGAIGELYIGGPGVSKGYFNDPELTKKRFLPYLGLQSAGELGPGPFYKTGDRVRWLDNHSDDIQHKVLTFIGRSDRQIKIRGFRVELGEIEQVLNTYPGVSSSLVIYNNKAQQPCLIAFIISYRPESICVAQLKSYTERHLPKYMQPSRIQILTEWPMTKQGKIDKSHLLSLLHDSKEHHHLIDSIEARLAQIWQTLLSTKDIHLKSNFFYLGGHSLLAMRLMARINAEFQTNLTLRNILESPCFCDMATLIKQSNHKKIPAVAKQNQSISSPLTFAQESLWLIDRLQSGRSINYNIAYAIHFKNTIDPSILEKSLNHILKRHEILRSVFLKKDNQVIQTTVEKTIKLIPEIVTPIEFNSIALTEGRTPFDLARESPLRIRLFQIDAHHVLLINHHHIIHDGFSIGILMEELKSCYEAFCANQTPRLPLLSFQYADHARQQRKGNQSLSADSLDYWCRQLMGYKPLLLPFRKLNARMNPSLGDTYSFSIDVPAIEFLRSLCSQEDCTLFAGLLAIFFVLFSRYCKEDDVAVASMMSTRDYQSDEHLIGIFLNAVILRQRVTKEDSFSSLLKQVKKTLLDATANRFTPLEHVIKAAQMTRLPNDHTLFDVMVSFHHFDQDFTKLDCDAFKSEIEFIDNKTAKFGITFDIYDNGKSLLVKIEYCTDLYTISSIKQMAQDYLNLINSDFVFRNKSNHILSF